MKIEYASFRQSDKRAGPNNDEMCLMLLLSLNNYTLSVKKKNHSL